MTSRERRAQDVQGAIREVLLSDWDPIGVRDDPEAQDEYDAYLVSVYRLLAGEVTVADLAEHLARIERDSMGLSARRQDRMRVALRLKQIDIAVEPT